MDYSIALRVPTSGQLPSKGHNQMQVWARTVTQIRYVMSKSKQQRSTAVDQIPCTLALCAISALITVLSTVSRKEKWRIVGAFFVGSVPRIAEGSTICGTNVRLRERPAGYFVLRCDSQDLTLQDILSNGVATVRQTLRRMFSAMAAERARKRRKLVLKPGYEQLTSIRLQRMPSLLLVRIRLEPGKTWKPGWLRRQACSSGSPMAGRWPLWERAK